MTHPDRANGAIRRKTPGPSRSGRYGRWTRVYKRESWAFWREYGLCGKCGGPTRTKPDGAHFSLCDPHRVRENARFRRRRAEGY